MDEVCDLWAAEHEPLIVRQDNCSRQGQQHINGQVQKHLEVIRQLGLNTREGQVEADSLGVNALWALGKLNQPLLTVLRLVLVLQEALILFEVFLRPLTEPHDLIRLLIGERVQQAVQLVAQVRL